MDHFLTLLFPSGILFQIQPPQMPVNSFPVFLIGRVIAGQSGWNHRYLLPWHLLRDAPTHTSRLAGECLFPNFFSCFFSQTDLSCFHPGARVLTGYDLTVTGQGMIPTERFMCPFCPLFFFFSSPDWHRGSFYGVYSA